MKFIPYYQLDGVPNIVVDGNPHKDSQLVLSHWINSGTDQLFMRDTSAQIVLDFLKNSNEIPSSLNVVSNDHFDQDGLVGVFSLIEPQYALDHYELLIDIATSGDFGKYKTRKAARISMAIANMSHPSGGFFPNEVFQLPYPEMAAKFYEKGIELLPKFIEDIEEYKELWEEEDKFLSYCEDLIEKKIVQIEENINYDLAILHIPEEVIEGNLHRFTVTKKGSLHDMAIHNATNRGRLIYSYCGKIHFRYRYETWVQLEKNCHPLRVNLSSLATKLSKLDDGEWHYQGSNKLVPLLERTDQKRTRISLSHFQDLLISTFDTEKVDWNPYP